MSACEGESWAPPSVPVSPSPTLPPATASSREDDRRLGLRSTALLLGESTRPVLLALAAAACAAWGLAGLQAGLAWPYFVAVGSAAAHMAWQAGTADYNSRGSLAHRFNSSKWAGALLLAGIVLGRFCAEPVADEETAPTGAATVSGSGAQ